MKHLIPDSQKKHSNVPLILGIIFLELAISAVDANDCIENRSLNRSAYQSSDNYQDSDGHGMARYAVDGGKASIYGRLTCTHTKFEESSPWWYVDLGEPLPISTVEVVNRGDGAGYRLNNFALYIGNTTPPTGFDSAVRCYKAGVVGDGQVLNIPCNDTTGRFVMIRIPSGVLSLCEVTVYAPCVIATKTSYFEMAVNAAAPNSTQQALLIRQARSLTECALVCAEQEGCETLNYLEESGLCQLFGPISDGMPLGGRSLSYRRKP